MNNLPVTIKEIDLDYNFLRDKKGFPLDTFQVYPRLGGWDMDSKSPTLKLYHSILWSRETPSGAVVQLEPEAKASGYLSWNNHSFGSDQIMVTLRYKNLSSFFEDILIPESPDFDERMRDFIILSGTMPGIMLWPKHANSMNQVRGTNVYIRDRFDLTLKCIQLYYNNSNHFNPIAWQLEEDKWFYDLFVSFQGFIEFFFLQDLIDEDGDIKYFHDFSGFIKNPVPKTTKEYWSFIDNQKVFLEKRRQRMKNYIISI